MNQIFCSLANYQLVDDSLFFIFQTEKLKNNTGQMDEVHGYEMFYHTADGSFSLKQKWEQNWMEENNTLKFKDNQASFQVCFLYYIYNPTH